LLRTDSTNLFTDRAVEIIKKHHSTEQDKPLFLYLAYQGVHEPRQSPEHYYDKYNETINDLQRRQFAGMLSALDEGVENVTAALRESSMLQETLWIVTTDNGGPTTECSTTGQSNWPFRGSKCSIWVREQRRALPTLSPLAAEPTVAATTGGGHARHGVPLLGGSARRLARHPLHRPDPRRGLAAERRGRARAAAARAGRDAAPGRRGLLGGAARQRDVAAH